MKTIQISGTERNINRLMRELTIRAKRGQITIKEVTPKAEKTKTITTKKEVTPKAEKTKTTKK